MAQIWQVFLSAGCGNQVLENKTKESRFLVMAAMFDGNQTLIEFKSDGDWIQSTSRCLEGL